ncbi:MAG TPA: hypothetical protein PKD53_02815 [Chloroflexaceae bacterium]|nr:hypothetical protein [Chloroflexaceae bacterium]
MTRAEEDEIDGEESSAPGTALVPGAAYDAEGGNDTADDLAWLSLEVQKAQRQINRGASEMAEGIVGLSVALLEIRRRRLYRFDQDGACARSFETFVSRRFNISERLARQYTDAIASLGEAQYHTLLRDIGIQRTFALALLHQADPALLEAFQMLPADEREAITATQIETLAAQVTADDDAEVAQRLAQLEQELGRNQGLLQQSRQRLRDIEAMHQRMVQSLIDERDEARQDADRQQKEIKRLRDMLRQPPAAATPPLAAPAPHAVEQAVPPAERQSVIVVMPFDVAALVVDVRALSEKLERLTQISAADVPPEQRRDLASSLQILERLVKTLLHS